MCCDRKRICAFIAIKGRLEIFIYIFRKLYNFLRVKGDPYKNYIPVVEHRPRKAYVVQWIKMPTVIMIIHSCVSRRLFRIVRWPLGLEVVPVEDACAQTGP